MSVDPERDSVSCHVSNSEEGAAPVSRREMIKRLGAATAAVALATGFGENAAEANHKYPVLICPVPISHVEAYVNNQWVRDSVSVSQSVTLSLRAQLSQDGVDAHSQAVIYDGGGGAVDTLHSSDYADFPTNAQYSDSDFKVTFSSTTPADNPIVVNFFNGLVGHSLSITVT